MPILCGHCNTAFREGMYSGLTLGPAPRVKGTRISSGRHESSCCTTRGLLNGVAGASGAPNNTTSGSPPEDVLGRPGAPAGCSAKPAAAALSVFPRQPSSAWPVVLSVTDSSVQMQSPTCDPAPS
eukprot:scaffold2330_cov376-Prasinococcus_capsulatus_cf.AAC.5